MFLEVINVVIFFVIFKDGKGWWLLKILFNIVFNDVVKFLLIKLNVGGGYDNNIGVFMCLLDGYYVVYWSVVMIDDSNWCFLVVMKNGVVMIGNEIGGNLVIFYMNRNDRVWIKVILNCIVFFYYLLFFGFKIL